VELNVHTDNPAQGFYEHFGFAPSGTTSDGLALVMRRKR
jgi:hypothetical protein